MDPHSFFQGLTIDQALAAGVYMALVVGLFGAIYWWVTPLFSLFIPEKGGEEGGEGDDKSPYRPPSAHLE